MDEEFEYEIDEIRSKWEVEEVELRTADGKVVAMNRIRFINDPMLDDTTRICRWCGMEVTESYRSTGAKWKHAHDGMIVCRNAAMEAYVPTRSAEPTQWSRGEVEEK